uniref:Uncharacterized protein n=1 Tax=Glossina austeni TaxID=7395 RepID=A0A1A9V483_GLOAU
MATNRPRGILKAPLGKQMPENENHLALACRPDLGQEVVSLDNGTARKPPSELCCPLSREDMAELSRLGELPPNSLLKEIERVYEAAYELGIQEAKEIARAKHLKIFNNRKKKSL